MCFVHAAWHAWVCSFKHGWRWRQLGPLKHWYPATWHGITPQKKPLNSQCNYMYIQSHIIAESDVVGRGNIVLVLLLTEHHAMKAYWGNGGIAPRILDLATRWGEWSASRLAALPSGKAPLMPTGYEAKISSPCRDVLLSLHGFLESWESCLRNEGKANSLTYCTNIYTWRDIIKEDKWRLGLMFKYLQEY